MNKPLAFIQELCASMKPLPKQTLQLQRGLYGPPQDGDLGFRWVTSLRQSCFVAARGYPCWLGCWTGGREASARAQTGKQHWTSSYKLLYVCFRWLTRPQGHLNRYLLHTEYPKKEDLEMTTLKSFTCMSLAFQPSPSQLHPMHSEHTDARLRQMIFVPAEDSLFCITSLQVPCEPFYGRLRYFCCSRLRSADANCYWHISFFFIKLH